MQYPGEKLLGVNIDHAATLRQQRGQTAAQPFRVVGRSRCGRLHRRYVWQHAA